MGLRGVLKKAKRYITDPDYRFLINAGYGLNKGMDDEKYIRRMYGAVLHKKLNLENPQTFNEKLQWLKLYDRKPEYTDMVDKYAAKAYVADRIGEEYIIPTYGVWERFDDIDFDSLPQQFVLKCTHDSGGLVICRDKSALDREKAKSKIEASLKRDFFYVAREWPYKNVPKRIIAEKYLEDGHGATGLTDYKFYCFNGKPQFLYVSQGLENHDTARISFITMDWEFAPYERKDFAPFSELPERPEKFDEMVQVCCELSRGHSFLRVDLYEVDGQVLFSELTFAPCGGLMPFASAEQDMNMGKLLMLPDRSGEH